MPNIKSAKKKVKQDNKKAKNNLTYIRSINKAIKLVNKTKEGTKKATLMKKALSIIDKTAKKKIIRKEKAAKLKSKISRKA